MFHLLSTPGTQPPRGSDSRVGRSQWLEVGFGNANAATAEPARTAGAPRAFFPVEMSQPGSIA